MTEFPIRANRAVVVDWKRFSFQGKDYVEWYERMCAPVGKDCILEDDAIQQFKDSKLFLRYHELNEEGLAKLRDQYGATHAVRLAKCPLNNLDPIYQDETYNIYDLGQIGGVH